VVHEGGGGVEGLADPLKTGANLLDVREVGRDGESLTGIREVGREVLDVVRGASEQRDPTSLGGEPASD